MLSAVVTMSGAPSETAPAVGSTERPAGVPAHVKNPRLVAFKDRPVEEQQAIWEAKKQRAKERRKAVAAERREAQQKRWEALTPEEKEALKQETARKHDEKRRLEQEAHEAALRNLADPATPALVFDFQFEDTMNAKGKKSSLLQTKFSYSILRAAHFPLVPIMRGDPAVKDNFCIEGLREFDGLRKYPPMITVAPWAEFTASLGGRKVVYLTPDTDTVLWDFEPDTAYVVGAFVDHNSKKGLTREFADKYGVATARLPIQECVDTKDLCRVLTINHVVESMTRFAACRDWRKALDETLPIRRRNESDQKKRDRDDGAQSPASSASDTEGEEAPAAEVAAAGTA